MSSGSQDFNFTINIGGNVFTGVANIDAMMNNLTATINKQESFWNKLNSTAFKFNNVMQSVKTIAGSVINTFSGWEQAYNIQASAETKLAQVMRNTMDASDGEIASIKELASSLQNLGVIGDEIQLAGAQELGTYLTKTDSLKTLMPVMNDMVAQQYGYNATQEQAVQIGSMMGKVMDGQVGALSRYGYKFTEAQEKILKYGTEQQRVATLADVVSASVGGMNEALAQTDEGRLKQHANAMGDMQERAGKLYVQIKAALLPVFEMIGEKLGALVGWFEANFDTISAVFSGIATGIVTAVEVVITVIGGIIDGFCWLWDVINAGAPILAGLATAVAAYALVVNFTTIKTAALAAVTKTWTTLKTVLGNVTKIGTAIQWLWNAALSANPLGIIIGLIAGLIAGVVLCWQKFAGFRAFILTMWDTIKGFGNIIKEFVIDRIKGLIEGVGCIGEAFAKLFSGDFSGAWESAKTGAKKISGYEAIENAVNSGKELLGGVGDNYDQHLATEKAKDAAAQKKKDEEEAAAGVGDPLPIPTGTPPSPIGDALGDVGGKAGADNGGKIKNINVTIEKVVENFTVSTTNLKESASNIKQLVADALVGAVNDLNYTVS